jgi:hypothetical protein
MIEQYTTPNAAKCRENSARLQRDTEAFLKNGGNITKLQSQLITETAKAEKLRHEAARKRGMKKFNGGIEK